MRCFVILMQKGDFSFSPPCREPGSAYLALIDFNMQECKLRAIIGAIL